MKISIIIVIVAAVLATIIVGWSYLSYPVMIQEPIAARPADAVTELTQGTRLTDIEQDLENLRQQERFLGDMNQELSQMEQELKSNGL